MRYSAGVMVTGCPDDARLAAPSQSGLVGVFDSGVGGLSILAALRARLPDAPLCYIGDVAHAPYGERAAADVLVRCQRLVEQLAERGARLIVVACNTATVLGIEAMRARWPGIAFVGIEPGIKPAVARTGTGRIALMVTPATAASRRLRTLIERHAVGVHVHVQACAGLAALIEQWPLDAEALHAQLLRHCAPIQDANVDTVALGCTHYAWAANDIQQLLGDGVALVDTAAAVAARAASLWTGQAAVAVDDARLVAGRPTRHAVRGDADAGRPLAALDVFSTGALLPMQRLLRSCAGLPAVEVRPIAH